MSSENESKDQTIKNSSKQHNNQNKFITEFIEKIKYIFTSSDTKKCKLLTDTLKKILKIQTITEIYLRL